MKEIMPKQLNWEVQEKPIYVDGNLVPNIKALQRSDDQKVLHVVSDQYKVYRNADMKALCDELEQKAGMDLFGFTELQGGKKVLAFLKTPKNARINGEPIREYIVLGNSFDGASSFFVGYTAFMWRCTNQFTDAKRVVQTKHLFGNKQTVINADYVLQQFEKARKQSLRKMEELQHIRITGSDIKELVRHLMGPQRSEMPSKRERALHNSIRQEIDHFGMNGWGLFNGMTHYTSNVMNKRNDSFGNATGMAEAYNTKAMNFILCLNRDIKNQLAKHTNIYHQ